MSRSTMFRISAAFEDARVAEVDYELLPGVDREQIYQVTMDLVEYLLGAIEPREEMKVNDTDDLDEAHRAYVLGEALARAFEAGLRVGREEVEDGLTFNVTLTKEQITGLVQDAIADGIKAKQ